jgi:hypothetical protein
MLELGAATQVRLWPLPTGTSLRALAAALNAAGLGPLKSTRVVAQRGKGSGTAGFVTFQDPRCAYRALGLAFPAPKALALDPRPFAAFEPPKAHRITVLLDGRDVALSATLARTGVFSGGVPGIRGTIHFYRR